MTAVVLVSLCWSAFGAAALAQHATLDLSVAGLEATIEAPRGASAKESFGAVEVTVGDTTSVAAFRDGDLFYLEIHRGHEDLAARKQELAVSTVNRLRTLVVDTDIELVYESEVMRRREFHFVANVLVGGEPYYCEDSKGPFYTAAAIDVMRQACQTLAAR